MPDPYYERLTIEFKIRKWLEVIWPTVYSLVNGLVMTVLKALLTMLRVAYESIKGFGF